jgi:hypothetical protein
MLEEVVGAMERINQGSAERLSLDAVLRWMSSDDAETLGASYVLLITPLYSNRIEPRLSFEQYKTFLLDYYERCFRDNPQGEWVSSRYVAGWDLVRWFMSLWRDGEIPRDALKEIKAWLARMYRSGDEAVRICIINATLEHLFEDRKVAKFFGDWRDDAVLGPAYAAAMFWPATGGNSPLGRQD